MIEHLPDFLRAIVSTVANVLLMVTLLQPKYSKKVTLLTMLGILAANAVLRIYARLAHANGIAFAARADLPEKLPMTDPEFGSLLSNLLENAVDACQKVNPAKRQLAFHAQTDEDGLRLEVRNSVCGAVSFEDGFPRSTKSGGGTGTRSIAHIVQKYGGMLRFKQESDVFLTQIVLPLKQ